MEINNATATSVAQLVNSPQPQPQPATNRPSQPESQNQDRQPSTLVNLSAQAQQMNRAEQNVDTERAETRPQEVAEPAGIQFMAGEEKGGRIDTFA